MTLKDRYHNFLDKYDAFMENPVKTHIACAVCGVVIGFALAHL